MNVIKNYISEQFKISFKSIIEFKGNFYSSIINNLFGIITQIILLNILYLNFNSVINWRFEQYLFFLLITNFALRVGGIFYFLVNLKYVLLKGNLNTYITKPIPLFLQVLMNSITLNALGLSIIYFIFLIIFFIYYSSEIVLQRLVILIPFILISILLSILIIRFIDSLAFFIKENQFLIQSYWTVGGIFLRYPITFFPEKLRSISYIFGTAFYGSYATMYLFNTITLNELLFYFGIILILNIVLSLGIYLLWKKGTEKYEAFD